MDLSRALERGLASGGQAARRVMPPDARISQPLLVGALLLFDALNIPAGGFSAYLAQGAPQALDAGALAASLAVATLFAIAALRARWAYTVRAMGDFPRQTLDLAVALGGALALLTTGAALTGFAAPSLLRGWIPAWFCGAWAAGAFARAGFAVAVKSWTRRGLLARRTVIVGGGHHALETISRLERSGRGALEILGLFDDRGRERLPDRIADYAFLGSFGDLEAFCRQQKVDLLIVAIPAAAETRILQILKKLWTLPVDIRISALGSRLKLRDRAYQYIGDVPFLPVFDKPISDWGSALKALFDRVAAALLIVALSPVLAAVALGVKLSSRGPILFRQTRYGFNNEKFAVFKFRSMYEEQSDAHASRLVTRGDPRVTPFGAFIRRWSLDELPQLFNVLRGDLSLVGPRPHALKAATAGLLYDEAVEGYFARHRVKPGITGWAQVNGWRGETDTLEKIEQRVAHDLYYIENWSIWLDLKILAMTPFSVFSTKNAF
ncbi:undecaprenyl-phosphate glucose phosphotransferase [Rhodoblastus sp.]|uniref:undecaprenyl-phosphate glucose phosphotransferase n=1 Tax=Rhodoblastus sp. TaxID=1962975 RepID=UPI00260937C5|nr:undecaprenyl-phosphate glucose phosphotransferase [Rhodoblastus sp.]